MKIYAFTNSTKSGAKTRSGLPCKSPIVRNKKRCRIHGGTNNGVPVDNQNTLRHGVNSMESKYLQKQISALLVDCKKVLASC